MNEVNINRAALHAELDDFLDEVARRRPDLELGDEHVITISGGCVGVNDDGQPVETDFTIARTQTRHA